MDKEELISKGDLNRREITIEINYDRLSDYHLAIEKIFECIENGGKNQYDLADYGINGGLCETRYIIDFESKQTQIKR